MNDAELLQTKPKLAPRVRLQQDPVTGEPVLLYPEGLLVLNETASEIVSRCDGSASVGAIIEQLAQEYDASAEELSPDVLACLKDLSGRNLLLLAP